MGTDARTDAAQDALRAALPADAGAGVDSTVKLARAVQPGDVLVAVGPHGEQLVRVHEVATEGGKVLVVTDDRTVVFQQRDQVRVAHPDVVHVYGTRGERRRD